MWKGIQLRPSDTRILRVERLCVSVVFTVILCGEYPAAVCISRRLSPPFGRMHGSVTLRSGRTPVLCACALLRLPLKCFLCHSSRSQRGTSRPPYAMRPRELAYPLTAAPRNLIAVRYDSEKAALYWELPHVLTGGWQSLCPALPRSLTQSPLHHHSHPAPLPPPPRPSTMQTWQRVLTTTLCPFPSCWPSSLPRRPSPH